MKIKFFRAKDIEESKDLTIVITNCAACLKESGGEVCMHCGENLYPKRITLARIIKDIPDVFFDVDSGLFYTIRTFFRSPGRQIKRYFAGDRNRHYKPLKYILFIGGFTAYIFAKYPITDGKPQSAFDAFGLQWTSLILLLQMPLIAVSTWLLFKKRHNTFGEHLVANAYIIAQVSLFRIFLFPFECIVNGTKYIYIFDGLYVLFILGYYTFVFYDWFYDRKGRANLTLSFILTFMVFITIAILTLFIQALLFVLFTKLGWA